jgi:hypothetical protein
MSDVFRFGLFELIKDDRPLFHFSSKVVGITEVSRSVWMYGYWYSRDSKHPDRL